MNDVMWKDMWNDLWQALMDQVPSNSKLGEANCTELTVDLWGCFPLEGVRLSIGGILEAPYYRLLLVDPDGGGHFAERVTPSTLPESAFLKRQMRSLPKYFAFPIPLHWARERVTHDVFLFPLQWTSECGK